MKQMVEALEIAAEGGGVDFYAYAKEGRQAIAEAEKQEPVAWMYDWTTNEGEFIQNWTTSEAESLRDTEPNIISNVRPLYTTPQQRTWVGLTDEEMLDCLTPLDAEAKRLPLGFKWFAQAIEAKLKDKNL